MRLSLQRVWSQQANGGQGENYSAQFFNMFAFLHDKDSFHIPLYHSNLGDLVHKDFKKLFEYEN